MKSIFMTTSVLFSCVSLNTPFSLQASSLNNIEDTQSNEDVSQSLALSFSGLSLAKEEPNTQHISSNVENIQSKEDISESLVEGINNLSLSNSKKVTSLKLDALFQQARDGNGESLGQLKELATQENSYAQNKLGEMYQFGYGGVQKSKLDAEKWYRRSAAQGDQDALRNYINLIDDPDDRRIQQILNITKMNNIPF